MQDANEQLVDSRVDSLFGGCNGICISAVGRYLETILFFFPSDGAVVSRFAWGVATTLRQPRQKGILEVDTAMATSALPAKKKKSNKVAYVNSLPFHVPSSTWYCASTSCELTAFAVSMSPKNRYVYITERTRVRTQCPSLHIPFEGWFLSMCFWLALFCVCVSSI